MYVESRDVVLQPVDVVYPLMRDHLEVIVPYLPSVKRIDRVSSKRTEDGRLDVVNHWYSIAEMPGPVRKLLKPEMFSWKDYALWNDERRCVDYRLESFLANDLYDASGTNYFTALGDGRCEIRVTCTVDIHAERVPGVPKLVARKTMPLIEAAIKQLLAPNLRSVGKGVAAYFRDPKRAATVADSARPRVR